MVSHRAARAQIPSHARRNDIPLVRRPWKTLCSPSKNNTGLARPQKGGIPHRFPAVTQEVWTELVLKGHNRRKVMGETRGDPVLAGTKGKN